MAYLTDVNIHDSDGADDTNGQKTMANGLPVTIASDQSPIPVVGNVAEGASDSGNPVKAGGVYYEFPAVLTNGQRGSLQLDASQFLRTVEQYAAKAEDNGNLVVSVIQRPLQNGDYSLSVAFSEALESSNAAKATPGCIFRAWGRIDATAPSDDYFVQVIDNFDLPADGAVTLVVGAHKVAHVNGTDSYFSIDCGVNGLPTLVGIVLALSTTEFDLTLSGDYMAVTATFK